MKVADRLLHLERLLGWPLPDDYRQFLLEDRAESELELDWRGLLQLQQDEPHDVVRVAEIFCREWGPLKGTVLPVQDLSVILDEGLLACLHVPGNGTLVDPPTPAIWVWDTTADLGQQVFVPLAETWTDYLKAFDQDTDWLDPVAEMFAERRSNAKRELQEALESFRTFVDRFHASYEDRNGGALFQHDAEVNLPRLGDWKPLRFCVHDHLLGVMAYRFNGVEGRVETTAFATKDHTNYARGSATRGLLLVLLAEWAKQRGPGGLLFVEAPQHGIAQPSPLPHEVALLAFLAGCRNVESTSGHLDSKHCEQLLSFLTLSPRAHRQVESSGSMPNACSLALAQVWTDQQIELLGQHCPHSADIFEGTIRPEEQLRFAVLESHARAAVMAGIAEGMVSAAAEQAASEDTAASTAGERRWYSLPVESSHKELAYSCGFECHFDFEITCLSAEADRQWNRFVAKEEGQGVRLLIGIWSEQICRDSLRKRLEAISQCDALGASKKVYRFLLIPQQHISTSIKEVLQQYPSVQVAMSSNDRHTVAEQASFKLYQAARRG